MRRLVLCFSLIVLIVIALFGWSDAASIAVESSAASRSESRQSIFSDPKIVRGDLANCQFTAVQNGDQLSLTFNKAVAASQGKSRDRLRCRIATEITAEPEKDWYVHSIQSSIEGAIVQSPGARALVSVRATFERKPILQVRETASVSLGGNAIGRSNNIPVDFVVSKAEQCASTPKPLTGEAVLDFRLRAKGDTSAHLDSFDLYLIYLPCN
ncbi:hypothetical protein NDI45_18620 [Leptolyngbya sp. GB1-A1]|uniref:hypothetical protein n=1 Tax=Leptolyngbya sp. GB1-A1 TaxID=2933908 RepID=UPI003297948C